MGARDGLGARFLPRGTGEETRAARWRGQKATAVGELRARGRGRRRTRSAPSTAFQAVPLPRFAREDKCTPLLR